MGTLIKNGTLVTSEGEYSADVLMDKEKIVTIGRNLDHLAEEIVDAAGKYLLPGGVDNHTHFGMPFGGTTTKGCDTSHAAVVGGTTTIVDFVPQPKGLGLADAVKLHEEKNFNGQCTPDYAFHSMVMDVNDALYGEILKLPAIGISSIKLFMAYKSSVFYCNDGVVFQAMQKAREAGVTLMVHAESADLTDVLQKQCVAKGQLEPRYHAVSRPPVVEVECVQRVLTLAGVAEAPVFIAHVSAGESVRILRDAAAAGVRAYGETCPQYICLGVDNLSRPNFEGAKYVCSPALRTPDHHEALLEALQRGWLQVFASDHSGLMFKGQKDMGRGDFTKIPNGGPGVQHRVNLLWTYGVAEGKLSRSRLVDVCATAPAKLNGLYPQKGAILVGADADIVVFDPEYKGTFTLAETYEGVDFTPYEGMKQIGRAEKVYVRGRLMAEKGKFVGEKGEGRFVPGKPYAAAYTGF